MKYQYINYVFYSELKVLFSCFCIGSLIVYLYTFQVVMGEYAEHGDLVDKFIRLLPDATIADFQKVSILQYCD